MARLSDSDISAASSTTLKRSKASAREGMGGMSGGQIPFGALLGPPNPLPQNLKPIFVCMRDHRDAKIVKRALDRGHYVGPFIKLAGALNPAVEICELRIKTQP